MEHILNCNLELCLSPPSSAIATVTTTATDSHSTSTSQYNNINRTGFHVVDVTELQARAIIVRATRQMEERRRSTCRISGEAATSSSPAEEVPMKSGVSPSMKRSLQRFLEKRKHRIQSLSPYTH